MKILHVLNHVIDEGNGIVNVAVDLAILQRRFGHVVTVASNGGGYEAILRANGVEHLVLDQARRPLTLLKAIARYRTIIRMREPDVVHVHMMTGAVLCRLLRRRRNEYLLVATVHNEFQRGSILMALADVVIGVSDSVASSMCKRGVPRERLHVVKNGTIGSPRRSHVTPEIRPLYRPAITTVAGLYHRKGITDLIEAFSAVAQKHSDAHLYIVGDGPDRKEFEQLAQTSPAHARIHFEGFQRDPERYLLATDIFALASRREPFGLVISEARAASCAVVATNVDGIPEALEGGSAGILVPARDPAAMAQVFDELLGDREELARWRTLAAKNLEWLTVDRVARELDEIYTRELRARTAACQKIASESNAKTQ